MFLLKVYRLVFFLDLYNIYSGQLVNIPYFDTSENFLKTWNEAYDYVRQNLVNQVSN